MFFASDKLLSTEYYRYLIFAKNMVLQAGFFINSMVIHWQFVKIVPPKCSLFLATWQGTMSFMSDLVRKPL